MIWNQIVKTMRYRPFFIFKYIWEVVLYTFNYFRWSLISNKNVRIGRNLHTLTTNCFNAERPNASIEIGDNFLAYYNVKLYAWDKGKIEVGNNCIFTSGTRIDSRASVIIGNNVLCNARIQDFEAHSTDPKERANEIEYSINQLWPKFSKNIFGSKYTKKFNAKPVVIEDNTWLAINSIILRGVTIGYGSIVAAGAVVTKDVPPFSVVAGNPAVVVKELDKNV